MAFSTNLSQWAVIYHDVKEGGVFWIELISTGRDFNECVTAMFTHFDDINEQPNRCLLVGDDMECGGGSVYFVADLNDPPKTKVDYAGLSRYYILHTEVSR